MTDGDLRNYMELAEQRRVELERLRENNHHTHANLDFCIGQRERALSALREIATMSGRYSDGGSGVYHDCESEMRTVARAAIAEIEA